MNQTLRILGIGALSVVAVASLAFLLTRTVEAPTKPAPPVSPPSAETHPREGAATRNDAAEAPPTPDQHATREAVAPDPPENGADSPARPRGTGRISGVVTRAGDGEAVAGASVVVDLAAHLDGFAERADLHGRWTVESDASGAFEVTGLPAEAGSNTFGVPFVVTASRDGASAVALATVAEDEQRSSLTLVLRPSGAIAGRVLDESGAPVVDAAVSPWRELEDQAIGISDATHFLRETTDAEGRFVLDHLAEGAWQLAATSDRLASVSAGPFNTGESNAVLVMTSGASASGTVIDAKTGKPVAGVALVVASEAGAGQRRVSSGADGAFTAAALADGAYRIYLIDQRHVWAQTAPQFTISRRAPVEGVAIKVVEGASVSGKVIDADSGEPLSGIRITAMPEDPELVRPLLGTSDEDGSYAITGLPAGSIDLYRERKAGFVDEGYTEQRKLSLAQGQVLDNVDFVLRRGVTVSGVVLDESGAALSGIDVLCLKMADDGVAVRATAGEGGRFEMRGVLPHTTVQFQVEGRGYTAVATEPLNTGDTGLDGVEIIAERGASVAGIVVDASGKPVPSVFVSATVPNGTFDVLESTQADGTFLLKGLRAGAYELRAEPMGSSWSTTSEAPREVTLEKGEALTGVRIVISAAPEGVIAGRITNARGEPVAEASVNANALTAEAHAFVESGADGRYGLRVEEGYPYELSVFHHRYSSQEREDVFPGDTSVDFVLDGFGSVEGRVVDAVTGRPITQFEVAHETEFLDVASFPLAGAVTVYNAEGRFRLDGVDAGEAVVFARAAGYAPGSQQVLDVRPDEVVSGVEIRLPAGATVEGVVRNEKGVPVPGARIYTAGGMVLWLVEMGGEEVRATSDAEGRFTLDSLGERDTVLSAAHPDYATSTVEVHLEAGKTQWVEMVMARGGSIEGIVAANGVPLAAQDVFVHSEDMCDLQSATTNAEGYYLIANVPPGEIEVSASVTLEQATRSENKRTVVESGSTATLNFDVAFGTGAIEGTLTEGGVPVAEGYISAMPLDGDAGLQQNIDGTVSPGGAYRISGLDAGAYKLMVNVGYFGEDSGKSRTIDTAVGDGETVHLDIDLEAGSSIEGTLAGVSDPAMCMVFAFAGTHTIPDFESAMTAPELQAQLAGTASVDPSGDFALGGLDPGDYTVLVYQIIPASAEGGSFASTHVTLGESSTAEVDLALP